MRRVALLAVMIVPLFGMLDVARADCGPGGSPVNGSGSCETEDGQAICGPATGTPIGSVSARPTGVEYCNSGSASPVQGRIGAQADCLCAYADGDEDNNRSLLLNGWIRVDSTGVHCREVGTPGNHAYNSSPGTDGAECVTQLL